MSESRTPPYLSLEHRMLIELSADLQWSRTTDFECHSQVEDQSSSQHLPVYSWQDAVAYCHQASIKWWQVTLQETLRELLPRIGVWRFEDLGGHFRLLEIAYYALHFWCSTCRECFGFCPDFLLGIKKYWRIERCFGVISHPIHRLWKGCIYSFSTFSPTPTEMKEIPHIWFCRAIKDKNQKNRTWNYQRSCSRSTRAWNWYVYEWEFQDVLETVISYGIVWYITITRTHKPSKPTICSMLQAQGCELQPEMTGHAGEPHLMWQYQVTWNPTSKSTGTSVFLLILISAEDYSVLPSQDLNTLFQTH